MNKTLQDWNHLELKAAAEAILPCNGSQAWSLTMAEQRPFASPEALYAASDANWLSLSDADWQQAFDSHPRIGEHKAKAATAQSAEWSDGEQSTIRSGEGTQAELAMANMEYETRFGRIFLVCATGKSANEVLTALNRRLNNDPAAELRETVEQQRQITQLRLRKWLGMLFYF